MTDILLSVAGTRVLPPFKSKDEDEEKGQKLSERPWLRKKIPTLILLRKKIDTEI